jgi:hypothetical protein
MLISVAVSCVHARKHHLAQSVYAALLNTTSNHGCISLLTLLDVLSFHACYHFTGCTSCPAHHGRGEATMHYTTHVNAYCLSTSCCQRQAISWPSSVLQFGAATCNWRYTVASTHTNMLTLFNVSHFAPTQVHLLGEERGPVLEVIVSRMRHISAQTQRHIRFLGLSTALANARDLADWLGVDDSGVGLYNFRPRYACYIQCVSDQCSTAYNLYTVSMTRLLCLMYSSAAQDMQRHCMSLLDCTTSCISCCVRLLMRPLPCMPVWSPTYYESTTV